MTGFPFRSFQAPRRTRGERPLGGFRPSEGSRGGRPVGRKPRRKGNPVTFCETDYFEVKIPLNAVYKNRSRLFIQTTQGCLQEPRSRLFTRTAQGCLQEPLKAVYKNRSRLFRYRCLDVGEVGETGINGGVQEVFHIWRILLIFPDGSIKRTPKP